MLKQFLRKDENVLLIGVSQYNEIDNGDIKYFLQNNFVNPAQMLGLLFSVIIFVHYYCCKEMMACFFFPQQISQYHQFVIA